MCDQLCIPCTIMRGGTSRAIFLKANDLPADPAQRDAVILAIFGSPDVRQIDGLAGADPLTSKLAIIGPPSRPDADVDYTFGQVSIDAPMVDYNGNCGNISSAVGPFAVDESLVAAREPVTRVRIHNTNTHKILNADVQVQDGKARVSGDFAIAGVPGTGAPILLDFSGTAGAVSGKALPTGNPADIIETSRGPLEVSLIDVANPCVFVHARSVGLAGTEGPGEIDGNPELLRLLEEIRAIACMRLGMAASPEEALRKCPAIPLLAVVSEPAAYTDFTTGRPIGEHEVDLVARMMFMQVLHKAYAGTGTACTAAAAKIPGTIVNRVVPEVETKTTIRIGHPSGVIPAIGGYRDGRVEQASFIRTARRIMDGYAYVEKARIQMK
jgi:2-methylaconitate cis-trans-isomerase PrpF